MVARVLPEWIGPRAAIGLLLVVGWCAANASAPRTAQAAGPKGPLGQDGRWITDRLGRVVILHGVNLVAKGEPFLPSARGFGADDAAFIAERGFNTVRLGINYAAIEPHPGEYDDAFIEAYARDVGMLAERGLLTLVDLHQDLYSELYGSNGMPEWMAIDDGFPREPDVGFPGNYLVNPALNRAFDNFWANVPASDGLGLQDHYAEGLRRLAARLDRRRGVLGYDIFNEPWPGTRWPTCANPAGCPPVVGFDQTLLTEFSRRVTGAIRKADRRHLVFYEPNVLFDFGAATGHGDVGGDRTALSFHNYCLAGPLADIVGVPKPPGIGTSCGVAEGLVFENAEAHARRTGDALLMTEFGATEDLEEIARVAGEADREMVGWHYWTYANIFNGGHTATQGVIRDLDRPPAGDNLKQGHLDVLVRPYPRLVAGTPTRFRFDPGDPRFELRFLTDSPTGRGPGQRRSGRASQSEIFVPERHFGRRYRVEARGARTLPGADPQLVRLRNLPGASHVSVAISDLPG